LQAQDRRRQLQEAKLGLLNARLDLAVLLFPDFNDHFEIGDDLHGNVALPPQPEFEAQAAQNNPEIRAALAIVQAASHEVNAARAGYLPTITLDYFYGIDATRYAGERRGCHRWKQNFQPRYLRHCFPESSHLELGRYAKPRSGGRVATRSGQARTFLRAAQTARRNALPLFRRPKTALNELAGLQRSAELSEESLRLTTMRYQGGEATVLEVVDAQSTFAQASAAYQDGAVRYRVALANLQTLTGVLTTP